MNNSFKISGLIIFILLLSVIIYYLYLTDFGQKSILSTEPRKPKLEIPITYNIDETYSHKALVITNLEVEIIKSNLNIFNTKALISYKVSGHFLYQKKQKPIIKKVHISERINFDTTLDYDRIIEITPIIDWEENKNSNKISNNFEFKNEHLVICNDWGINKIKFICKEQTQTIKLERIK